MLDAAREIHEKAIEDGSCRSEIVQFHPSALEVRDQGIRYTNEAFRPCQIFYRNNRGQIAWRLLALQKQLINITYG
jgi:hypothetical protein